MQEMQAEGGLVLGTEAELVPGLKGGVQGCGRRFGNQKIERLDDLRVFDLRFLREEIGASAAAFVLAFAGIGGRLTLVCMAVMAAVGDGFDGGHGSPACRLALRMMPATSQHGMQEEGGSGECGDEGVHSFQSFSYCNPFIFSGLGQDKAGKWVDKALFPGEMTRSSGLAQAGHWDFAGPNAPIV